MMVRFHPRGSSSDWFEGSIPSSLTIELKGEMNYGITINYKFILAERGFIHIFNIRIGLIVTNCYN